MKLIVETDLGHDPDDFFALCYLFAAGVDIQAILLSPGDVSQVAIVRFLLKELGKENVLIGVPSLGRSKEPISSVHKEILERYRAPLASSEAMTSAEVFSQVAYQSDVELFVIGPLKSLGRCLQICSAGFSRATMQGGFIGYEVHKKDVVKLEKFTGRTTVPTFNLNGDVQGATNFLGAHIFDRRFVSKNVCHTVVYDRKIHERVLQIAPKSRADEIFREAMTMYLTRHFEKKFHDPTAAVCHLHPEIATWVKAKLYRERGEWGARLDESQNDQIIIDIDYDRLWDYIAKGV